MEWYRWVIAGAALAVPVWLAWQSYRGRVDLRCCAGALPADKDARMRGAFDADPLPSDQNGTTVVNNPVP